MVAACIKFVIFENVRYDDPEPMKTSPSVTFSQPRAILHSWFRFGRNTGYFWPTEHLSIRPLDWKFLLILSKRNQECRIALSCDKVILGEVFRGSGSSYLTFSKITNFIHAATTEFKFYVIMKWAIPQRVSNPDILSKNGISSLRSQAQVLATWWHSEPTQHAPQEKYNIFTKLMKAITNF